jgi:hypothetical protein
VRAVYPEIRTRRHIQNIAYQVLALGALEDDPTLFAAFCSAGRVRTSVLAQLGRLRDDDLIRDVARIVVDSCQGWREREIEAAIRRLRYVLLLEHVPDPANPPRAVEAVVERAAVLIARDRDGRVMLPGIISETVSENTPREQEEEEEDEDAIDRR